MVRLTVLLVLAKPSTYNLDFQFLASYGHSWQVVHTQVPVTKQYSLVTVKRR